jgi:hypothetical protein
LVRPKHELSNLPQKGLLAFIKLGKKKEKENSKQAQYQPNKMYFKLIMYA